MCPQRVQELAGFRAPQACCAVGGSGGDDVALRAVADGEDVTRVTPQRREPPSGADIVETRRVTLDIGRDERRAVRRELGDVREPLRPADPGHCRQHA